MNGTTADNKLTDMRGNASAQAYNGVQMITTEQLGEALVLDGKDSFIELKDVKSRCIVDPTDCNEGLSVAFWIKYTGGNRMFFSLLSCYESIPVVLFNLVHAMYDSELQLQTDKAGSSLDSRHMCVEFVVGSRFGFLQDVQFSFFLFFL